MAHAGGLRRQPEFGTPDAARPARAATFALMALAYLATEVAAHPDGRLRPFGVVFGAGLFALAVAGSYLVPRPAPGRRLPGRVVAVLAAVLVLPAAVEPLLRALTGNGLPLEMQMVNGLRNLGLALAAAAVWPVCLRLAGVVALFLALFASAMGDQPQMPYALGAFAAAGGVWLVLVYRADLAGTATAGAAGELVGRAPLRFPLRELGVFGLLAAAAAGVAFAGPKQVMLHLGEWVPTSGGTGDADPFARYGTNDGPEEVAGDNAASAGMVESERLIEDTKDSLIDAVNDTYGEPQKPPKKRPERMVAAGRVDIIRNHDKLPDNRRPSRDFDTARKGPKSARKPASSEGPRGVYEVEGRTPLHIRMAVYDRYDADAGVWREAAGPSNRMLDAAGGDWMARVNLWPAEWYAADDAHRLKVAEPRDAVVPTPPLLTRFRVQRVDKVEYYAWAYDGVLALDGRTRVPPGLVVRTECRTLDPPRLPPSAFAGDAGVGVNAAFTEVPAALAEEVGRRARAWAGDAPRGWPQVAAVLDRLRADYELDPAAASPPGHPSPVRWFLEESRRGPDYLFATSAALALRSLGYAARVCAGYYAGPDAYDPETRHTPVGRGDLHVWPEVLLRDNHWLVVEPTPGYGVLPPLQPWSEWLYQRWCAALAWAGRNALALAAATLLAGLLVWRRADACDLALTAAWRLAPGRTWRQAALRSLWLLERRAALAGVPRPPHQTWAGWSAALAAGDRDLGELVRAGEWAAFAPDGLTPPAGAEGAGRRAVGAWTLRRFRGAVR